MKSSILEPPALGQRLVYHPGCDKVLVSGSRIFNYMQLPRVPPLAFRVQTIVAKQQLLQYANNQSPTLDPRNPQQRSSAVSVVKGGAH